MPPSTKRYISSLAKVGTEAFYVCDPADAATASNEGVVSIPEADETSTKVALLCALVFAVLGVGIGLVRQIVTSDGNWFLVLLVGAVLGGMVGVFVGSYVGAAVSAKEIRSVRQRRGKDVFLVRKETEPQQFALCRIVSMLGRVAAWQSGVVDPNSRVPGLLWEAVSRSKELDKRLGDATRALGHASLRELAQQTVRQVGHERQSIDQVEQNLKDVLLAARSIDERRKLDTEARLLAERQRREERELRTRLTGMSDPVAYAVSNDGADESAGLAAEAVAISKLLAASDRILRGDN